MSKTITLADFAQARGAVQTLNPDVARKAIQGYTDAIAPAAKADAAFYNQFVCPSCRSDMIREFIGGARGAGTTWLPDCATAQALLRCLSCKLLMNPRSGLIVDEGHFVPTIPLDDDVSGVHR
jgi:hypothetical protein